MEDSTLNPVDIVSSDRPLESPDLDRLGYAPFACHLAKSLTETLSHEGLVLGLYGDWGSGKSTLINFLIKELGSYDEKRRPILVKFNPWWYSGSSSLVSRFLLEFSHGISGWTRVSDKFRESFSDLADVLGDVGVGGVKVSAGKAVSALLRPNRSAERLREKVVQGLEELDRRILVIVDDVDRLHRDEILHLFLAIKAIGSFPRTNYVLAMDKRVVVDALDRAGFGNGEEFLEKIIQVPLSLPDVDPSALEGMLSEQLNKILSDLPEGQFDLERWGWLFTHGIRPILRTPRQVIRLVNCLSMVYPVVKGEVNPVDLIGIEMLKLFFDPVYQAIRRNPSMFLPNLSHWSMAESDRAELENFHQAWLGDLRETLRSPAQYLVSDLFPGVAAFLSSFYPISTNPAKARRELRICAPERFPVYFRLWVPAGELRASEVAELMDSASEGSRFAGKLIQLSCEKTPDGTSRAGLALDRLADLAEEPLPAKVVVGALEGLLDVGDRLLELGDRKVSFYSVENNVRISRCIYLLSRQIGQQRYGELLGNWVAHCGSITVPLIEVRDLAREHGHFNANIAVEEDKRRVTSEAVELLRAATLKRLSSEALQGTLLKRPWLGFLLNLWRDLGREEDAKNWVASTLENQGNFLDFLAGFTGNSRTSSSKDGMVCFIHSELLQQWADPKIFASWANKSLQSGVLSARDQGILEAFVQMQLEV
ncbi:MAG TPA: P-loop NTPase fold protein [Thermoanaerobaculia bacterium]